MTDELISRGSILTSSVEAAFRAVPRHLFIPEVGPGRAYRNEVVPIGTPQRGERASSASQPSIVAWMLEGLRVQPGERVLEVGSGSGYNAALLAHLVGEEGRVVTVELEAGLAHRARKSLARAGFGGVEVIHADGGLGHPGGAPYDRIVVTAAAPDIAPAWREQLTPAGRLALPLELWPGLQVCAAFEPAEDYLGRDHLLSVAGEWCGFLPMGGESADSENTESERPDKRRGSTDSATALEARLRGLRAASLATGLPFPEWLRIRAYRRELDYALGSEEVIVEKSWSRLVLEQL